MNRLNQNFRNRFLEIQVQDILKTPSASGEAFYTEGALVSPINSLDLSSNQASLDEQRLKSTSKAQDDFKNESQSHFYFLPVSEQIYPVQIGQKYLCYVVDEKYNTKDFKNLNIVSLKLEDRANAKIQNLKTWDRVDLYVIQVTELGYKCLINGEYIGLLYKNEVFKVLKTGDQLKGSIKNIRADKRIDLLERAPEHFANEDIAEAIMTKLKEDGGFLKITDKTEPELIYELFGVSKKKFKIALGGLYKKRKILIKDEGIEIV